MGLKKNEKFIENHIITNGIHNTINFFEKEGRDDEKFFYIAAEYDVLSINDDNLKLYDLKLQGNNIRVAGLKNKVTNIHYNGSISNLEPGDSIRVIIAPCDEKTVGVQNRNSKEIDLPTNAKGEIPEGDRYSFGHYNNMPYVSEHRGLKSEILLDPNNEDDAQKISDKLAMFPEHSKKIYLPRPIRSHEKAYQLEKIVRDDESESNIAKTMLEVSELRRNYL